MNKFFGAVLAVAVLTLSSTANAATIVTSIFRGTVDGGLNTENYFGGSVADLLGKSFEARLTWDADQTLGDYYAGVHFIVSQAPVNLVLTIDGADVSFTLPNFQATQMQDQGSYAAQGAAGGLYQYFSTSFQAPGLGPHPQERTPALSATGDGGMEIRDGGVYNGPLLSYISFDINEFEVQSPLPEPGTWAMMIAGFGLVGGAIRRRRSALQPV